VAVVRAILLLTVHRDPGRVHIQRYPLLCIDGLGLADEFAVDAGHTAEVLLLGQNLSLKRLQTGGQCRAAISSLLRTDQPEPRIWRELFGVVDILIARDAAIDGLAQQIGHWKLGVLPAPRITQVLGDRFAEARRSSNSRTRSKPPSEVIRDL
jgi:hypothetical protein